MFISKEWPLLSLFNIINHQQQHKLVVTTPSATLSMHSFVYIDFRMNINIKCILDVELSETHDLIGLMLFLVSNQRVLFISVSLLM